MNTQNNLAPSPPDAFSLPVLDFAKVESYTTFLAEYAVDDVDLVFHFFVPPDKDRVGYWQKTFPACLEEAVTEVFKTGAPRIQAAYVSDFELRSWWMKAKGFAAVPDPDALVMRFFDKLDEILDQHLLAAKNT